MDSIRAGWVSNLDRIARPVLKNAAEGRLHETFPATGEERRRGVLYLEAVGRTVAGIAPWLELDSGKIGDSRERALQQEYREWARRAMANAADPENADYCVWNKGERNFKPDQPVVDAAYFAGAILKAPVQLWELQTERARLNILRAFDKVLLMRPLRSNWLLFTALIEACRYRLTGIGDAMRIDYAVRQFQEWYVGDGLYSDGDWFAMDYYNSYVIHPMLEEVTRTAEPLLADLSCREHIVRAMQRYCEIQERMIAPDGSFPHLGRSITYCMGAFHALSHAALFGLLPETLPSSQVRTALTRVMDRVMNAPGLFDENGFLRKGLYGSHEKLGESYISAGSLYLTSAVFLPLGLPPADPFWSGEDVLTSWERAWGSGTPLRDTALEGRSAPGTWSRLRRSWKRKWKK